MVRKYDIDETPIKINLKVSDNCPNCGSKHLFILHIAALKCRACGGTFNRYVKS